MTQELKILQRKTPLQQEMELYVFLDGALLNLNDADPIIGARSQAEYEEEKRIREMWNIIMQPIPKNWLSMETVFPLDEL